MNSSNHPINKNKITEPFCSMHEPTPVFEWKKCCELGGWNVENCHISSDEVLMNKCSTAAYRTPEIEMQTASQAYRMTSTEIQTASPAYRIPANEMQIASLAYRMPANDVQAAMLSLCTPNFSVVNLVDSFFSEQKLAEPVYKVDKALERDIAIGGEWLFQEKIKLDSFYNSIKKIEENKVYSTNIFFNDLQDIDEIKENRSTFKFIRKIIGYKELTNIDFFFDQIQKITPAEVTEFYGDFDFLHEVCHLIEQRDQIEYHLKLKALIRFIESAIHESKNHNHTPKFLSSPLILHLREYIDNIYNIKKIYLLALFFKLVVINSFNINAHEQTIRDRFIMFSN